ncbi:MAG TPA: hypothetical protein DD670_17525 [Planctomycetaceae bacterium]|nr:hypothetical protein [Planctomycetaceae bacterium]
MCQRLFCTLTVVVAMVSWGGLVKAATGQTPGPLPKSLPPYLQNPMPDGMTVCFLVQKGAGDVRVLWHREGDAGKPTETTAIALVFIGWHSVALRIERPPHRFGE